LSASLFRCLEIYRWRDFHPRSRLRHHTPNRPRLLGYFAFFRLLHHHLCAGLVILTTPRSPQSLKSRIQAAHDFGRRIFRGLAVAACAVGGVALCRQRIQLTGIQSFLVTSDDGQLPALPERESGI